MVFALPDAVVTAIVHPYRNIEGIAGDGGLAIADRKPSLVTLPIDYRENGPLTQRLGEIVCSI